MRVLGQVASAQFLLGNRFPGYAISYLFMY